VFVAEAILATNHTGDGDDQPTFLPGTWKNSEAA
jgi:hypothetical protein